MRQLFGGVASTSSVEVCPFDAGGLRGIEFPRVGFAGPLVGVVVGWSW
jgi:hypothetical protein